MARETQETLFEHFRSIAADSLTSLSDFTQMSSDNRAGVTASDTTIPEIGHPPPLTSSSAYSRGNNSGFGTAAEMFGGGLGIVPLVSGLLHLFGGARSAPPVLTKYQMPQTLDFVAAEKGSGVAEASFNQIGSPEFSGSGVDSLAGLSPNNTSGSATGSARAPQINVSVQAMDAQSFLDHSADIAQAVRHAMLNLSSINDVVNDL
jgi:hypothetical protein